MLSFTQHTPFTPVPVKGSRIRRVKPSPMEQQLHIFSLPSHHFLMLLSFLMVFSSPLFLCSKHFSSRCLEEDISPVSATVLSKGYLSPLLSLWSLPRDQIQPLQLTTCLAPSTVDAKQKFMFLLFSPPPARNASSPELSGENSSPSLKH